MLLCISTQVFAHDFAVVNSDGDTIYYKYTVQGEVAVTYKGDNVVSYSNEYTGEINIPSSVTYNGNTYSVTSIGKEAFYYCADLIKITMPNGITNIGEYAFYRCRDLTNITIPNGVTSIENYAFCGCDGLISVTIPNSLISIGNSAFDNCSSLTNITIPNSVTSIGYSAFYECIGLTSVTIGNSITSILNYTFSGCRYLTNVIIPNGVTSIGNYAFENCSGLMSITIPNSVTDIGDGVFKGCSGLSNITIPNNIISIGKYVFEDCSGLTSVVIPNNVTTIGREAFYGCDGLTSIIIPNSVISIDEYAFYNCLNLNTIRVKADNPPTIYATTFDNGEAMLIVPCGRLAYYQNAENWSNFVNIIEDCNMDDTTSALVDVYDDEKIIVYPNPIIDNAILSIDNLATDVQVVLTDMQGRIIKTYAMKSGESTLEIETNNLKSGTYFLRIVGENMQRTEKIFKK